MKVQRILGFGWLLALGLGVFLPYAGLVDGLPCVCAEEQTRTTDFPSGRQPDQICLMPTGDPCTAQTIQWRTSPAIEKGFVQFSEKTATDGTPVELPATLAKWESPDISNDPVNHRYSVALEGLKPGITYRYRVGNEMGWSDWAEFTTAPKTADSFSFFYVGDPQVGLDKWGRMLQTAQTTHPDAAFCIVAGDNVNRGNNREEWDALFQAAGGLFSRRPYVPALGNHDCAREEGPKTYLGLLTLPENGPVEIGPERAYRFEYSNALFIVMDSNSSVEAQRPWLEQQLQSTKALWKFVAYHHPAYSSKPERDNPEVREIWGALFDKYHVDMALQGHDHGYLRTKPMRAGKAVDSAAEGTVYVVSVSGAKLYDVGDFAYAEKAIGRTSVYQVIDIKSGAENKLTYCVYDKDGKILDEMTIVK